MEKYQSYKSSGIEWIGEVPKHWENRKFKWDIFYQEGPGLRTFQFTEEGIRVICVSNITEKGIDFETTHTRHISKEEYNDKYKHFTVDNNDILLSSSGSIGKVSKYNFDGEPVILNTSTIRIHSKNKTRYSDDFVKYVLISNYVQIQLRFLMTGGIVSNFGPSHLDQIFNYLPPIKEQHQIVQFLDSKTELIDKLISTKERKITLLKEQRTLLINQVVTKGLNPNVKMKDSGVKWIGEIPECWKISKLGFYTTKIGSGSTPKGGSEVYPDSGIPFIRSQNVHFDGLRLDDVSFIDLNTHKSMKGSKVIKDDVLLNITGGSIGRCCIVEVEGEMNVNQHVSIIRTTHELVNYFLNYILCSDLGQSQVIFNLTGGNREGLTIEGIRNFRITIPPIHEQLQIVEHLDFKTKEIDYLVQLEQKKIDLLKEYRQSLISEVVTGKIKVTTDEKPIRKTI